MCFIYKHKIDICSKQTKIWQNQASYIMAAIWWWKNRKSQFQVFTKTLGTAFIAQTLRNKQKWLDFVVDCRRGIKHDYDIVEGPMADDQIWDYVEDFMEGSITREAFWILAKFKYLTHQIVFCTQKALEALTYEKSYRI